MKPNVIIVGAGIAGLVCALECVRHGRSVCLVYHGAFAQSSSYVAQGGIAAAWREDDDPVQHMTDTIMAGDGLCDTRVVQDFCDRAPEFIRYLMELGVPFDTSSMGEFQLTREGAHASDRIFHVKDYTGTAIIRALLSQLKDHPLVDFREASLEGLLCDEMTGRVVGIRIDGTQVFSANTVLATGGFSNMFRQSTNPTQQMGQGIALAYLAGAALGDLEFIQFHPTVYCATGHPPLLISEALRGEGAFLVNKNNDRFMVNYHELGDLAPRDVVSRAIVNEAGVKLNISPLMTTIDHRFPTIFKALCDRGFQLSSYEIPIQPMVHYTLGGIVAAPDGQTSCDGLFAIGECAVTGFHGANRLASNSLLEAGVMGQRCAQRLIQIPDQWSSPSHVICHHMAPLLVDDRQWLQQLCCEALGLIRTESSLRVAIESIQSHASLEHPLFQFGLKILQSAFYRHESRGGHYRSDYPSTNDDACHSMVSRQQEVTHVPTVLNTSINT